MQYIVHANGHAAVLQRHLQRQPLLRPAWGCLEPPQGEPGGAKRSQEEPRGARWGQGPWGARGSQGEPVAGRRS